MKILDIQKNLEACSGICVEIGGPTPDGYIFLQEMDLKLPRHMLITNIVNPVVLNPFGASPKEYPIDAVIDIQELPYDDHALDMLITSSLPHHLHDALITNASVALRHKGILVIENELPGDADIAHVHGFKPLLANNLSSKYHSQIYQLH